MLEAGRSKAQFEVLKPFLTDQHPPRGTTRQPPASWGWKFRPCQFWCIGCASDIAN